LAGLYSAYVTVVSGSPNHWIFIWYHAALNTHTLAHTFTHYQCTTENRV